MWMKLNSTRSLPSEGAAQTMVLSYIGHASECRVPSAECRRLIIGQCYADMLCCNQPYFVLSRIPAFAKIAWYFVILFPKCYLHGTSDQFS